MLLGNVMVCFPNIWGCPFSFLALSLILWLSKPWMFFPTPIIAFSVGQGSNRWSNCPNKSLPIVGLLTMLPEVQKKANLSWHGSDNEVSLKLHCIWSSSKPLVCVCFVSYVVSRLSLADGAILPVGINTRWREEERGRVEAASCAKTSGNSNRFCLRQPLLLRCQIIPIFATREMKQPSFCRFLLKAVYNLLQCK